MITKNFEVKHYEYTYAERLRLARWTAKGLADANPDKVYKLTTYYCNYLKLFKGLHDNNGDPYNGLEDGDRKALFKAEVVIMSAQETWLRDHFMEAGK